MKPCSRHQPRLAWLAAGVLPDDEAQSLREHCDQCPACREYLKSMTALCAEQRKSAEAFLSPTAEAEAAALEFHQRWRQRLHQSSGASAASGSKGVSWLSAIRGPRFVLGLGGVIAVTLVLATLFWGQPPVTPTPTQPSANVAAPMPDHTDAMDLAERSDSLRSYRLAMNAPATALDALLAQNATKPMPTAPGFRALQREIGTGIE